MSNSHLIVGLVSHIDLPPLMAASHRLSFDLTPLDVVFANGERTSLDPNHPLSVGYAEILDDLRRAKIPGYVELDANTRSISRLLIPIQVKVAALVHIDSGDVAVRLEISHTQHLLKKANSQFSHLLGILEDAKKTGATVLVTDTDDHEIIDVRIWEVTESAHEAVALKLATEALSADTVKCEMLTDEKGTLTPALHGLLRLPAISEQRLNQIFCWLASKSCNPRTVPAPCIPFLYPDDGCWGRAHEMVRLINSIGNLAGKVWIYGNLRANTRNNPNCYVLWGWHVAPIFAVTGWREYAVVDPSMFPKPVTLSVWRNAQQDSASQIVCTACQVFYRSETGYVQYDPNFSQTAQVLATYRAALKLRSLGSDGPPPYIRCR
jgi:hypothetical protein